MPIKGVGAGVNYVPALFFCLVLIPSVNILSAESDFLLKVTTAVCFATGLLFLGPVLSG